MSMLFSRTAIILVWLVVFGLFALFGPPMTFATGVVLLPVAGVEVSAVGVAGYYAERGLLGGWVIDERDRIQAERVEGLGLRVAVTDTIMADDEVSERLARTAVDLTLAGSPS